MRDSNNTVFWELPDGTKTIGITETPCVCCDDCRDDGEATVVEEKLL